MRVQKTCYGGSSGAVVAVKSPLVIHLRICCEIVPLALWFCACRNANQVQMHRGAKPEQKPKYKPNTQFKAAPKRKAKPKPRSRPVQ